MFVMNIYTDIGRVIEASYVCGPRFISELVNVEEVVDGFSKATSVTYVHSKYWTASGQWTVRMFLPDRELHGTDLQRFQTNVK